MSSSGLAKFFHVGVSIEVASFSTQVRPVSSKWSIAGSTCSALILSNFGKPEKFSRGLFAKSVNSSSFRWCSGVLLRLFKLEIHFLD